MASRQEIADYITAQISGAGAVRSSKLFGEYSIYCNDKVVALVADDQLFVKPTAAGRAYLQELLKKHLLTQAPNPASSSLKTDGTMRPGSRN